jgi:hypothetical protein
MPASRIDIGITTVSGAHCAASERCKSVELMRLGDQQSMQHACNMMQEIPINSG